ncbi:MAG: hypothetical protein D6785_04760 [Planctomycetota bacterium]|nr:MAG: hypothetical protein D6785_04760 [Planctomycetota bacterium]
MVAWPFSNARKNGHYAKIVPYFLFLFQTANIFNFKRLDLRSFVQKRNFSLQGKVFPALLLFLKILL